MSVIVPAFNVAPYVATAVRSALSQTLSDLEVLVVDDGSSDGTAGALDGIDDPRVTILRRQHGGLAAARNAGIRQARGTYIAFLDGDDLWEPTKLSHHVAYLAAHAEVDVCFALHRDIDESGAAVGLPVRRSGGILSFGDILVAPPAGKAVLRREVLACTGLFDPDLAACEDVELWLRVSRLRAGNVAMLPLVLDRYRRRPGQITADWRRMQQAWGQVRERARAIAPDEFDAVRARADAAWCAYLAFLAHGQREYGAAVALLRESFAAHPHSWLRAPRRWLLALACVSGAVLPQRVHRALSAGGIALAQRLLPRSHA